eukprot:scaffold45164_cov58-Phaeocystis_antarctica.AAC.2
MMHGVWTRDRYEGEWRCLGRRVRGLVVLDDFDRLRAAFDLDRLGAELDLDGLDRFRAAFLPAPSSQAASSPQAAPPAPEVGERGVGGAEVSEGPQAGCGSEEVLERAELTSASRACSRSAFALTSTPAPSSSDDVHASHASFGAFALMNAHLPTSSKRAKRTGSSLSASLPIKRMRGPSAAAVCGRAFCW